MDPGRNHRSHSYERRRHQEDSPRLYRRRSPSSSFSSSSSSSSDDEGDGRRKQRSRWSSYISRRRNRRERTLSPYRQDGNKKRQKKVDTFRRRSRSWSRSRSRSRLRSVEPRRDDSCRGQQYGSNSKYNNSNNNMMMRDDGYHNNRRRDDIDATGAYGSSRRYPQFDPHPHQGRYRRSYSLDREHLSRRQPVPPPRQQQQRRRREQQQPRRRRSRSLSSSSASSFQRRRMPRPRGAAAAAAPVARAGVVSDDDDAAAALLVGGGGPRPRGGGRETNMQNSITEKSERETSKTRNKRLRDSAHSSSQAQDDTVGHFWGGPGTVIADRYRVERELGVGTFGRVVECLDLSKKNRRGGGSGQKNQGRQQQDKNDSNNDFVALKMVRKIKRYYESALIEADIVSDVNRRGGPRGRGTSHFAVMYDAFNFRGHYCLVFESLGPSLYDYLKRNKYQPFPMDYIRDFSRQLLEAIEFLHSFRLIHTDLKPENILVTKCRDISYGHQKLPESTRIKVIDFGGATFDYEKKSSVVNTRQYRAPEVILSCGWSMPSDLWSAGCILAELYQGELLFATHDNLEHLALIEWIIGPFPRRMLQRGNEVNSSLAKQAFNSNGRHRMERVLPPENANYVLSMPNLESIVCNRKDSWFLNLLRSILVIDPGSRSSARDALRASFG